MFQAQVIQGNDLEFDALLYPTQHFNTINYIQHNLTNIPANLLDQAKPLFENAYNKYKELNSHTAKIRAMNAISSATNIKRENIIYPIKTIEDSQQASLTMQRWIMAEPNIRTLYHNQQCDGYSDTYVDVDPTHVGESHYDWRRVMNGVVLYDNDELISKHYMDTLHDGDRELSPIEQHTILTSWELIKIAVSKMNDDPTSPFGGKL